MTDNGLAALAERLKPYQMPDPWTDDLRTVVMVGTAEEVAAAILGPRGVFLPEGLGPVMVGMAKEIAALRAALDGLVEAAESMLAALDMVGPRSLSSGDDIAWAFARGGVMADLRAALVAAKETP